MVKKLKKIFLKDYLIVMGSDIILIKVNQTDLEKKVKDGKAKKIFENTDTYKFTYKDGEKIEV